MKYPYIFSILLIGLLSFTDLAAQSPYDYRSPVDWPIKLSGTFGELRPGHFHMGIDIKSPDGGIGHTIRSIGDGYVSRLKVSSGGYGKVLYIVHPTGHESVYAHLDQFPPAIEAYVRDQQYALQSFEVDLEVFPYDFEIKKGDAIGTMGMTGRTFGPHLHFEVRDKWSKLGLDPLKLGIPVDDVVAPRIMQLVIYELDANKRIANRKKITPQNKRSIAVQGDWVGIGVKTYDQMQGVRNLNGVHSIQMSVDGQPHWTFDVDTLNHFRQRYINAHKDFKLFVEEGAYVNQMFRLPGNDLQIYQGNSDGIIPMDIDQRNVRISVFDSFGNHTDLEFSLIKMASDTRSDTTGYHHLVKYDEASTFNLDHVTVHFPIRCVYSDTPIRVSANSMADGSFLYQIHDQNTPVHEPYELRLMFNNVPDSIRSKVYLKGLSEYLKAPNLGGEWQGDDFVVHLRHFGIFQLATDTTPPTIERIGGYQPRIAGKTSLEFKITDDLPNTKLKYSALMDGEWCLMEFDAKKDLLIHKFDWDKHQKGSTQGWHELVLTVEDANGNTATKSVKFNTKLSPN